jgi:hypothetical protein
MLMISFAYKIGSNTKLIIIQGFSVDGKGSLKTSKIYASYFLNLDSEIRVRIFTFVNHDLELVRHSKTFKFVQTEIFIAFSFFLG